MQRARLLASLTIPGLLPPEGANGSTNLPQPFQSIGADCVNNLAAQLFLVLFPPGTPYFRLVVDELVLEKAKQGDTNADTGEAVDVRTALEEALGKVERAVTDRMEQKGARAVNFEVLQHLIVTGNALKQILTGGGERMFPLDSYVVKRDLEGNVIDIVIKETLARQAMPQAAQDVLTDVPKPTDDSGKEASIDFYTWVKRAADGSWTVMQEIEGKLVPGTTGTYPQGKCPFLPLRWRIVPRNDYGRGRCEEYLGDLFAVDTGNEAILRYGAAAAKILFFCEPGGQTNVDDAVRAKSGDFINGSAKDISVLMLEKSQDFQVLKAVVDEAKNRLEKAFLMATSVQRDAERVTAEEIRAMVGQLEQSLGGQYALLSEELQRPTVEVYLHMMQVSSDLPQLPAQLVSPQIVTGIEGLGRNTDLQKLTSLLEMIGNFVGPQNVPQYVNVGNTIQRLATAQGIDIDGIVKSQQQIADEQQQAQQAALQQQLAPSMVQAGMKGAELQQQGAAPAQATPPDNAQQ